MENDTNKMSYQEKIDDIAGGGGENSVFDASSIYIFRITHCDTLSDRQPVMSTAFICIGSGSECSVGHYLFGSKP